VGGVTAAAEAIEEILQRSGLTKSELSARSGVSRALLDDYLKGRRRPAVAQLERLGTAAGLRMDITWRPLAEPDGIATPSWARPNPTMRPEPLTVEQRAMALEMVCDLAMELPARQRGELEFPPFRTLARR